LTAGLVFGATATCIATPSGSVSHRPSFGPCGCGARPSRARDAARERVGILRVHPHLDVLEALRPAAVDHAPDVRIAVRAQLERVAGAAHVEAERLVELLAPRRATGPCSAKRWIEWTPVAPDRRFRVSLPCMPSLLLPALTRAARPS
jgi:hypothetical protein